MDVNYLLHREQVEQMRAEAARNEAARAAHSQLAALYRKRVDTYRAAVAEARAGHLPLRPIVRA